MDLYKELQPISRAGKQTVDKFLILKDRESILTGKRRKRNFYKRRDSSEMDNLGYEESTKPDKLTLKKTPSPKNSVLSPSFKTQDRLGYYKSHSNKDLNPPLGHYDPNFKSINRHISSPTFLKVRTETRKSEIIKPKIATKKEANEETRYCRISTLVNMKNMLERKPLPSLDFNENRLLIQNLSPRI